MHIFSIIFSQISLKKISSIPTANMHNIRKYNESVLHIRYGQDQGAIFENLVLPVPIVDPRSFSLTFYCLNSRNLPANS